jgi:hypothetical protein
MVRPPYCADKNANGQTALRRKLTSQDSRAVHQACRRKALYLAIILSSESAEAAGALPAPLKTSNTPYQR